MTDSEQALKNLAVDLPTPWVYDKRLQSVHDANGNSVLIDDFPTPATLRYICRCVNSHAALLAACRAAEDILARLWQDKGIGEIFEACEQVRNAIAAAEGRDV